MKWATAVGQSSSLEIIIRNFSIRARKQKQNWLTDSKIARYTNAYKHIRAFGLTYLCNPFALLCFPVPHHILILFFTGHPCVDRVHSDADWPKTLIFIDVATNYLNHQRARPHQSPKNRCNPIITLARSCIPSCIHTCVSSKFLELGMFNFNGNY